MPPFNDLTGRTFARLTVQRVAGKTRNNGKYAWFVRCQCGSPEFKVACTDLTGGKTRSCGCYRVEQTKLRNQKTFRDLTGKVFTRLTVIRHAGKNSLGQTTWVVRCTCGKPDFIVTS